MSEVPLYARMSGQDGDPYRGTSLIRNSFPP